MTITIKDRRWINVKEQNAVDNTKSIAHAVIWPGIDEDPPSEAKENLETNEQYIIVSTT